jgi:glycosyltransferase involved in cell wall biosynthesis
MTAVFVNNTDLMSPEWRFIEPFWTDPRATWEFFHGVPRSWLERRVPRPHLGRYRAALQAVRAAQARQPDSILVSHLPAMAAATNIFRRRFCPEVRHIAFAFNFTDLPSGPRLSYFRWALQGIDEFVVFSEMERQLYATTFGLPPDRFHMLPWAMEAPELGHKTPVSFDGPYLCAIGGEGRDYALLAEVMHQLPQIRMVVVARPYSVAKITFPKNVTVFTNLPPAQTWKLAKDSIGLVVPLKSVDTACGHITIVAAQLLNIPLVVTRSHGVLNYVSEDTAFLVAPQDKQAMANALRTIRAKDPAVRQRQKRALETARDRSSLTHWVRYFEGLLDR